VGNLAIAGRDMTFNQSCYGLRGTKGVGDYFVYLTAQKMVDQLKSMAHGSVFSTITRQTFEAIRRPVPPPAVLEAFERLVTKWFETILSSVEESRTLAQLRDTLLPKLISGELRIADAERFWRSCHERFRSSTACQRLHVRNYRALKDITLERLTPLTVLLGPNGSGKSTVFDVFAFLSECFSDGLRKAWERRGRFRELRSRDQEGTIEIEIQYREKPHSPLITYHLEIEEQPKGPVVKREFLRWKRGHPAAPFHFLDYQYGQGKVITGESPESSDTRVEKPLSGPDVLAVNTLGTLAENPRVIALRSFITGWHLSYLSADAARGNPEAGAEERLSPTGNNLPNVIQYLREQHPQRLEQIFETLRRRIPRIEKVEAEVLQDSRLLLLVKDAPFSTPVLSRFASDGTLKMLAYLTVLYDPDPPQLIGIERTGKLSASTPTARTGRGVPAGIGADSADRHHAFAFLHQSVAARRGAGSVSRFRRLHASSPGQ